MKRILYLFVMVMAIFVLIGCDEDDVIKYTVEFVNTELEVKEVVAGSKVEKPSDPEKLGYIFDDWYEDEDFTKVFDFEKEITKDTKIYALFYITIPKLLELGEDLENNAISSEEYYVKGTVKNITNVEYGNMTITDGENDLFVYGVFSIDGSTKYEGLNEKPVVDDIVYLRGPLKRFNNQLELNNSKLIKFEKGEPTVIDLDEYEEVTILEARSFEVGSNVIVEGVVARITYANNNNPNGIYLVDETNSIYIYDNKIASSVNIGNTLKVAGTRTNFILETEKSLAEKFGYEGAIQLDNAILINKEDTNLDFATEWIQEATIKDIMETDYTQENITSTIFKVNALVKKVPGTGFTNYYFYDLDGETGSYTYTMNNGNDFKWLDEFDNKLMTVYLSVINAKASNSGILYRFLPIKVLEEFEYDESYNPEFAVKYYGIDQFEKEYVYSFSPDLELITNISSELLGIENVKLTYSSSNEDVAYFEEDGDKLIFKTKDLGVAIITITGVDGENTYVAEVEVKVVESSDIDYISVIEAIESDDDTLVTVQGIVAASLVNQSGFYLIDESGVIAVRMAGDELAKVALGNKVIIQGTKTHIGTKYQNDSEVMTAIGQIAIVDALVLENQLGNHEYSTDTFIEGKELADLIGLDLLEDHSTEVYIIEATIKYEATPFYTRYSIIDDNGNSLLIYSSNANQLKFLEPFQNQKVTLELALVNWNGNGYRGAILAVINNGEKVVNNSNFN